MTKKWHFFLVGAIVPVGLLGVFLVAWWAKDVRDDRKHFVTTNAPTPLFAGTGEQGGCRGTEVTTVERGTILPVLRIRYLKDCATLDVVLPDGRRGYFILGVGDISINPPLPMDYNNP